MEILVRMKIKLLFAFIMAMVVGTIALAQTGQSGQAQGDKAPQGAVGGQVPKMRVAIVDTLAFRDKINELKVKYTKLDQEFNPKIQQVEAMQQKLAAQEKTLKENRNLNAQQTAKLTEEYEVGKRDLQRLIEDSRALLQKRETEETEAIFNKVIDHLNKYCAKHGITAVFEARRLQESRIIVYAAATANITDDFINEYNKANPAPAAPTSK
jgi:Skp family chaperone for outer membrane proteins